ncbi:hypothetical protein P153DRAFT_407009 [Dothidotthia symphoricarpi CBS 119687]|uniref:Uncharacterized protein n=1 Tax=Dothidotthia symphoricarpi CBS 119687 TaxID=1392245 RepID=A0A6A6A405_9PLEO|nr:uncharacterized protein P153DRAFT_407009 [Dothidotthia symphoricarpi CBS 119687]KAF2126742.1 hypothetical protein P153DRAFT_407009 [Dothidotthia symphoricarpi CBS 119687]
MRTPKMKLIFLLLVALFTAISFASPIAADETTDFEEFEDIDGVTADVDAFGALPMDFDNKMDLPVYDRHHDGVLEPGTYWDNGRTVYVIENDPTADEDLNNHRFADLASVASSNADSDAKNFVHKPEFTIGGKVQNVGDLHGQRMWDKMYECLEKVCPVSFGQRWCGKDRPCIIPNIMYVDDNGRHKSNGRLEVYALASRHQPTKNLGAPLHEMTAGVFAVMSERPENCYFKDGSGSKAYKICNIAEHVLVRLPAAGRSTCAYMSIQVKFKGGKTRKNFDCEATKEHVDNFFNIWVRKDFTDGMGVADDEVQPQTFCKMDLETKCFSYPKCWDDWKENYKPKREEMSNPWFWPPVPPSTAQGLCPA